VSDNRLQPEMLDSDSLQRNIPKKIGRYTTIRFLSSGAMGTILLAEDEYKNKVVIKLLKQHLGNNKRALQQFFREAQALGCLDHRNISRIIGSEMQGEQPYIVMEYVDGVSLSQLLKFLNNPKTVFALEEEKFDINKCITIVKGQKDDVVGGLEPLAPSTRGRIKTLPLQQSIAIIIKICDAVHFAHERGIFHRDIKPSNIALRQDGEPVLLDFGVAHVALDPQKHTERLDRNCLFGTIDYMAPEQAISGNVIDERADVYSIGAVLYELVTGKKHFNSSGLLGRDIERLKHYTCISPRSYSKKIDKDLQAIILKAVAPNLFHRYRSTRQLAVDLHRYQEGLPVLAKSPTPAYRISKYLQRNIFRVSVVAAFSLLTLLFALYFYVNFVNSQGAWHKQAVFSSNAAYDFSSALLTDFNANPVSELEFEDGEMVLQSNKWYLMNKSFLSEQVGIELTVTFEGVVDGLELIVLSQRKKPENWWHVPPGYSAQVGGYMGKLNFISVNQQPQYSQQLKTQFYEVEPSKPVTIRFEKEENVVSLWVDNQPIAQVAEVLPVNRSQENVIGFRTFAPRAIVSQLSVYHKVMPRRPSSLVTGDVLYAYGLYKHSVQQLLQLHTDYPDEDIGKKALLKAIRIGYLHRDKLPGKLQDSLLHIYTRKYPKNASAMQIAQWQILAAWKYGEYESVLDGLSAHFVQFPQSNIVEQLYVLKLMNQLPPEVAFRLLHWVLQKTNLPVLQLTGVGTDAVQALKSYEPSLQKIRGIQAGSCGLQTLDVFEKIPLEWLDIMDNDISSLHQLRNKQITFLDCSQNPLRDFSTLKLLPLTNLRASETGLSDLQHLPLQSLRSLSLANNNISSLSPLKDKKAVYLDVSGNKIRDISALSTMDLQFLDLSHNPLSDISALRNLDLRILRLCNTNVSDLSAVESMKLSELDCSGTKIKHLGGFAKNPPRVFYFFSDSLPIAYCQSVMQIWQEAGRETLADYMQLFLYLRTEDIPALLQHYAQSTEEGKKVAFPAYNSNEHWQAYARRHGAKMRVNDVKGKIQIELLFK